MDLPIQKTEIEHILSGFRVAPGEVTDFRDSSRGQDDVRWNFIFGREYVLKINTPNGMWEDRLQEIARLIERYRAIGVYCPGFIPTVEGTLSHTWTRDGKTYTCYVEEYAKYPAYGWENEPDKAAVVEHLGLLAARYADVDLSGIHSMWSIIDLGPFDTTVDEKQENADDLEAALKAYGLDELANRVAELNRRLRSEILPEFRMLPRCVFQGDLNSTNELHDGGQFAGLIDFNCSGTDVNINVFLNETNWFPEERKFDQMPVGEILAAMDERQAATGAGIYRHYALNDLEKKLYPCFKRIVDLFQYPNVCAMRKWLGDDARREKCVRLIEALVEKPL